MASIYFSISSKLKDYCNYNSLPKTTKSCFGFLGLLGVKLIIFGQIFVDFGQFWANSITLVVAKSMPK
jgi:hypothetical protein